VSGWVGEGGQAGGRAAGWEGGREDARQRESKRETIRKEDYQPPFSTLDRDCAASAPVSLEARRHLSPSFPPSPPSPSPSIPPSPPIGTALSLSFSSTRVSPTCRSLLVDSCVSSSCEQLVEGRGRGSGAGIGGGGGLVRS
jgi:hypothetical protein